MLLLTILHPGNKTYKVLLLIIFLLLLTVAMKVKVEKVSFLLQMKKQRLRSYVTCPRPEGADGLKCLLTYYALSALPSC